MLGFELRSDVKVQNRNVVKPTGFLRVLTDFFFFFKAKQAGIDVAPHTETYDLRSSRMRGEGPWWPPHWPQVGLS